MQPYSAKKRAKFVEDYEMLPPAEAADAILFAATPGARRAVSHCGLSR